MTTNDQKKLTATGVQKKLSATGSQELYSLLRGVTSSIGSPYPFSDTAGTFYLLLESGDKFLLETGDKMLLENG